jgi:hypothetical protein
LLWRSFLVQYNLLVHFFLLSLLLLLYPKCHYESNLFSSVFFLLWSFRFYIYVFNLFGVDFVYAVRWGPMFFLLHVKNSQFSQSNFKFFFILTLSNI